MSNKAFGMEVVRKVVCGRFWQEDFAELFDDGFTIEYSNAPPGMPQIMDEFEVELYFDWLRATVMSWEVTLEELYSTPNPNVFWAVSVAKGKVFWGGQNGLFESKRFSKYTLSDGKIVHLKEVSNPLSYLKAAGREPPLFRMDLYDERIEQALAGGAGDPHAAGSEPLDTSPEAVAKRISNNLLAFMSGDYWQAVTTLASYAPDCGSKVWFLPPQMQESYPPELMPRVEAWSMLSCPSIEFDHRGVVYATDDPLVYFCEYMCKGVTDWIGNNAPNSRYRNRYFYILRFNEAGQIKMYEEILNPINKFNSINVSLPSFPYYY